MFSVETTSADISSLRDMDNHIVKKQCELLRTEKYSAMYERFNKVPFSYWKIVDSICVDCLIQDAKCYYALL
jgi:hypothetical protein